MALDNDRTTGKITMVDFQEGQHVRIIRGLYKSKKLGVYIKPYGAKMCCVKVNGDNKPWRNLRLTSIEPIHRDDAPSVASVASASAAETPDEEESTFVTISRLEYNALLHEIDNMGAALRRLQLRVIAMDNKY